ncbi:uncharacterized protein LOC130629066 [Hydractinia symbiolongicarpus]|uniref:uncharacterized protein LOC130629066 n=1 Tax=Hydractinia symbiolongicarpus TaxID=13093 RepID=UPI0025518AB6|nr:uncharacterized protein LOC130629066 [Hydractinia symbiolongicarpus]
MTTKPSSSIKLFLYVRSLELEKFRKHDKKRNKRTTKQANMQTNKPIFIMCIVAKNLCRIIYCVLSGQLCININFLKNIKFMFLFNFFTHIWFCFLSAYSFEISSHAQRKTLHAKSFCLK